MAMRGAFRLGVVVAVVGLCPGKLRRRRNAGERLLLRRSGPEYLGQRASGPAIQADAEGKLTVSCLNGGANLRLLCMGE